MTLHQAFPGLNTAPGGAIVAVADDFLNVTGPANEMTAEVLQNRSKVLMAQIKTIDPTWHHDELGPITTVQGLSNKLDDLRFQYAAVAARVKKTMRRCKLRQRASFSNEQIMLTQEGPNS